MDLWIRSQDRKTISKANKIYMEHNEERMYNINIYDDCSNTLGTYKTKERALEVLDEINEFKDNMEKAVIYSNIPIEEYTSTFEMPEE